MDCYDNEEDSGTELSWLDEVFLSLDDDLEEISLPNQIQNVNFQTLDKTPPYANTRVRLPNMGPIYMQDHRHRFATYLGDIFVVVAFSMFYCKQVRLRM